MNEPTNNRMRYRSRALIICALALVLGASQLHAQSPEPTATPAPIETPFALPTLPPQTIRPLETPSASESASALVMLGAVLTPLLIAALAILFVWLWRQRVAQQAASPYLEHLATGKKFYLTRETQTLGRASDCQIKIGKQLAGADTLSLRHARLFQRGARWMVADGERDELPSLNGIAVNDKRTLENYLDDGDVITFGEMQFRFHLPAPRASGAAR